MPYEVPSVDDLRARAGQLGIHPTGADLERVLGFLRVLLPQIDELERLVPRTAAPAALYRPELEP